MSHKAREKRARIQSSRIAALQRGRLLRRDSNRIRISEMLLSRLHVPAVPRLEDDAEQRDAGQTLLVDPGED